MGFGAQADEVQDRFLARDYAGAAAAVPFEFLDRTCLLGDEATGSPSGWPGSPAAGVTTRQRVDCRPWPGTWSGSQAGAAHGAARRPNRPACRDDRRQP